MKRIKTRWDLQSPESRSTANLEDNTKRFKKKRWGNMWEQEEPIVGRTIPEKNNKQLNCTTKMKIDVVTLDKEERSKGMGFMKRVEEKWDQKYPEYHQASWQKLRDDAVWFKKEPELINLILVGKGEEQPQDQGQQQEGEEEQIDFERAIVNQVNIDEDKQVKNSDMVAERIELSRKEFTEEDQNLKEMFIIQ